MCVCVLRWRVARPTDRNDDVRCARSRSRFYFHRNGITTAFQALASTCERVHLFMLCWRVFVSACAPLRRARACVCCVVHTILHQICHARLHFVPSAGLAFDCFVRARTREGLVGFAQRRRRRRRQQDMERCCRCAVALLPWLRLRVREC